MLDMIEFGVIVVDVFVVGTVVIGVVVIGVVVMVGPGCVDVVLLTMGCYTSNNVKLPVIPYKKN